MSPIRRLSRIPTQELIIAFKDQEIVECLRACGAKRAADELQRVLVKDLESRIAIAEHAGLVPTAAHR